MPRSVASFSIMGVSRVYLEIMWEPQFAVTGYGSRGHSDPLQLRPFNMSEHLHVCGGQVGS